MRDYFLTLFISIILLSFYGCSKGTEGIEAELIRAHYTSEFSDKEINLAKKLGERILLVNESRRDTTQLSILYNKAIKTTTIIDNTTKDTLFNGKVYKHRGLHYFCSKVRDSVYWISAVKVKRDRIQGLGTDFWQMFSIDELLDSNENSVLHQLVDKNKPDYALAPDKKIVSAYYASIIDSFPVLYRLNSEGKTEAEEDVENEEIISNAVSFKEDTLPVLKSYYPNPVEDVLNMETNLSSDFKLTLTNEKGEKILEEKFSGFRKSLGMNDILSGIYFLQISSDELQRRETVKIWVK